MPVANAPVIANPEVAADAVANVGRAMDFSLFGLFMHVDFLGKFIILTLLSGSIVTWAIIFSKYKTIGRLHRLANKFEDAFWSGESLDKLYDRMHAKPADPMTAVFCIGMKEWRRGVKNRFRARDTDVRASLVARIDRVMNVAIGREMSAAERYMTFLASVGSTAPFIGLLGTVWGIMNSFIAIAGSNNTALSVVAPGIAEALYTTALSLIVAIPAVLAYNKFNADLAKYADRLDGFSTEFSSILARYLEESSHGEQSQTQQQVA
jgi:biopolymer transport protein TolQ